MITKEVSGIGTPMHKFLEDYINTGQWKDPRFNPITTSTQDGESSP